MGIERDYMIQVGMELLSDDAAKIKASVEKLVKDLPPIKLNVSQGSGSGLAAVKQSLREVSTEVVGAGRLMDQFYEKLAGKGAKQSAEAMVKVFGEQKEAATEAAQAEIAANMDVTRSIEAMIAANREFQSTQRGIRDEASRQQSAMQSIRGNISGNTYDKFGSERLAEQQRRMGNSDMLKGFNESLQPVNSTLERTGAMWERYGAQVQRGIQAHQAFSMQLPDEVQKLRGFADELAHTASTFAVWSLSAKAIEGATHTIGKGFSDAVHMQKEQTITGMYYQAAGGDYTPNMSAKAQAEAINMARLYGEEVSHVTENIGLWAKVTNGQLNPAIALTDSAMKINAISGMNMEEIYRDTIAVMGQLQEPLSRTNDLYNIATGLALRYGGGIQSLGGESQDAVKQMMDGMTRLTAIMVEGLGRGPDTLAKIGAEVATVANLTSESGDAVAGHLAAAFAKIEGGELTKNLHSIGIETRNNTNLFDQMGAKWGQVMPILQKGGVRPGDLEFVKVAIDNADKIKEAFGVAKDAMKDAAADKAFETLQGTLDMQLKQLRSGWEAVGIAVAQSFMPQMQNMVSVGNNEVIPWLLANKDLVGEFGKQIASLGAIYAGVSIATSVLATGTRIITEFSARMAGATGTVALADRAMNVSFTSIQRGLASTLSETNEMDEGMEASIKILAAQYGLSIDQMILKLRQLQQVKSGVAVAVSAEDEIMATSLSTLSARVGVEAGVIETEFTAMRTSAQFTAKAMGEAFLAMIPVVGEAVGVGLIAYDTTKMIKDHADGDFRAKMKSDPTFYKSHMDDSRKRTQDALNDEALWRAKEQTTGSGPMANKGREWINSHIAGDQQTVANEAQFQRDYPKFGASPKTSEDVFRETLKRNQAEIEAHERQMQRENAAALAKTFVTKPHGEQDFVEPKGPAKKAKKPKGIASQGQMTKVVIDQITAEFDRFSKNFASFNRAISSRVDEDKRHMSTYGVTTATYKNYATDITKSISANNSSVTTDRIFRGQYQDELNTVAGRKTKPGTTDYVDQQSKMKELKEKIASIDEHIRDTQADTTAKAAELYDTFEKLGDTDFAKSFGDLKSGYSSAASALRSAKTPGDVKSARSTYDSSVSSSVAGLQQLLKDMVPDSRFGYSTQQKARRQQISGEIDTINGGADSYTNSYNQLHQQIGDQTQVLGLESLGRRDPALQTGVKATLDLKKQYDADVATYDRAGKDTTELDYWRQLQQGIINAKFALDEYNEKKQALESTAGYKAFDAGVMGLGGALQTALDNNITRPQTNFGLQAQNANNRIGQLKSEDSMIPGYQYMGIRFSNTLQERQLSQQADAAKYKEAHPSLLTSVSTDVSKSFVNSFTQQLEKGAQGGFLSSVLGKDPKNDPAAQAQTAMTQAINNGFDPSVTTFKTAADTIMQAAQSMLDGSSMGGGSDPWSDDSGQADMADASSGSWGSGTVSGAAGKSNTGLFSSGGFLSKELGYFGTGSTLASLLGGNAQTGGMYSALGGAIGGIFGPAGGTIGSLAGSFLGALGPKYNESKNPDIVDPQTYSQFVTNLQGGSYNGSSLDPGIAAQTGGLGQGAFIENFLKGKTTDQLTSIFGTETSSIQSMFGQFNEMGGITDLHNGNLNVSGENVNWQQINQLATDAFTQISSAANSLNQALAPIISVAAYGSGGSAFSPYYTPGYGDASSLYSLPYPLAYSTNSSSASYNPIPSSGGGQTINTSVQINGREVAQAVSDVRSQQIASGFQPDA